MNAADICEKLRNAELPTFASYKTRVAAADLIEQRERRIAELERLPEVVAVELERESEETAGLSDATKNALRALAAYFRQNLLAEPSPKRSEQEQAAGQIVRDNSPPDSRESPAAGSAPSASTEQEPASIAGPDGIGSATGTAAPAPDSCLVPREPSEAMLRAIRDAYHFRVDCDHDDLARAIYRAMLSQADREAGK